MNKYIPLMSKEEIERRIKYQNQIYLTLKDINEKKEFEIFGKEIIVLPGIFVPMWGDSLLLAKAIKEIAREGDFVLDLGTGTGVQGIFAASNNAKVISSDINLKSIECMKKNRKKFNLEKQIEVRLSDLFENISEKFDIIIFNPPFRWFKPRDMLERGTLDENYRTLTRFFSEVGEHLLKDGKIILAFSESGDVNYLEKLIKENRFNFNIINRKSFEGWDYLIYIISK
jgi:release factor glutamine methyltransferase